MKTAPLLCFIAAAALITGQVHARQDNVNAPELVKAPDENSAPQVEIKETRIGTGAEAMDGSEVAVHYTGWLVDPRAKNLHGKKFDSSFDRNKPITFVLGSHRVIPGWEQGLAGMKVGGKRTLIIPSELAYGERGAPGVIPPNAALIFDVELMAVK